MLDCQSLRQCPPALQHLAIRTFMQQHQGEVSYYTCEDPLTLPYGVLKSELTGIKADALCFFTTKQLVHGGFDFPFLEELLAREGGTVGFAREGVIISPETYKAQRPWLWREGLQEGRPVLNEAISNLQEKVIGPARMTLKDDLVVIKSFKIVREGLDDTSPSL